ncbi:His Kinase A (phospho-acceptor) domain-containing protein [Verrucomicrobium sp. GAS474]|uniref:sensor histidine kinase n=1 Tax=Verrucomicrobium sp. GAS474 TaxID=1882831 RepID=UPI000879434C|nr:ATP-binding protein [Verrucomicrobium sp. GAS474]SDT89960.1 His Kinase A (phospho-acceptor) domain-containing protein [Verrucomicrobium sp. GAS474]
MKGEPRVNILIVDDEESNLLALEVTLEALGQNVIRADSGEAALRQVLNQDFAVILLDVQMAGMNGIETATLIRERERSRHIPIIFLTGMVKTDEMMFKGYSAGAVDYLMKPILTDVLCAKVEVFIELAQARIRLQEQVEERTRAASEISKLNAELEQKNTALLERTAKLQETVTELESYSYSISHDMRAPLRAMQGYADILTQEACDGLTPEHQAYLKKISSGARRLDSLIQDILNYSRLSSGPLPLQPVDLDRLIRDIIEQYPGMQVADAAIRIEGELPPVRGNEASLTQCIANLLGNAIKFTPPDRKPEVAIRAEREGNDVVVWFADNGIGIAPRDLERIFGIFVKVHSPETYAGTGIGLSIVRKAAERMGGKIGVESELGKGSRFWLRLPRA